MVSRLCCCESAQEIVRYQDAAIGKTVYAEDSYVDFGWHLTSEKLQIPYGCAFDETDPSYDVLAYGA